LGGNALQKNRYLELLKSVLVNEPYLELEAQLLMCVLSAAHALPVRLPDLWSVRQDRALLSELENAKQNGETILLDTSGGNKPVNVEGNLRNYTEFSYTLVGRKRLDHLQACIEDILEQEIPGDFLEAGVWRGGCCILMRAVLAARNCEDRNVWLADSFAGVPRVDETVDREYRMDASRLPFLAVSEDEVKRNFQRFDLLDEQVRFLPGFFDESLQTTDTGPLALLRIDCDLYSSTRTVLECLYPRLSSRAWVIVDDYGILPPCRKAVDDFRSKHDIISPLERIDRHAVCWRTA
jgi:O-methyltransferase